MVYIYFKVEHIPIASPCSQTNDLAIILDVSENVGPANFDKFLNFIDQLAAAFTHHSKSRLTFIVSTMTRISLTNIFNPSVLSFRTLPEAAKNIALGIRTFSVGATSNVSEQDCSYTI